MSLLDLGGGLAPAPGHINIDIIKGADIVWDLNKGLPEGIIANSIEGIRCHQVLEHLTNIIPLMNDCYTVLKNDCLMEISVPYFGSHQSAQDPTHVKFFVEESFYYFTTGSPYDKEKKQYGITANFYVDKMWKSDGWLLNVVLRK